MFEPVRGGTRGGQAEFKWTDVSADKDREHYLGHSINAPTGRWQKNKDIHWYNRDVQQAESERIEEIRKIKELEAQAINAVLGYEPTTISTSSGPASGSNAIAVTSNINSAEAETKGKRKEERWRRKEEKRTRKELKKMNQSTVHGISDFADRPIRHPSRSRSPTYRSRERQFTEERRPRSLSRTPITKRRTSKSDYDDTERERERESNRRRWDYNSRRSQPVDRRRY